MRKLFENLIIKLGQIFSSIVSKIKKLLLTVSNLFFSVIFNKVTIFIFSLSFGFVIGARLHEVGFLDGKFGKSLRGATVFLSGPCKVSSSNKITALAEDEVKVTGLSDKKVVGVIRKTREIVECESDNIAIDKLPVLANILKSPVSVPEIQPQVVEERKDPDWKKLEQRTLIVSGKCSSEEKDIPPFSDEVIDVTSVEKSQNSEEGFVLMGIRKSDKITLSCESKFVKYSLYMQPPKELDLPEPIQEEVKEESFVGQTILVTGTCFPDSRLPKHKQKQRVAFYPLVNARVQLTEEHKDESSKTLDKLSGAALDAGVMIVCDKSKAAFTYKKYDPDSMRLAPLKDAPQLKKDEPTADGPNQEVEERVSSGIGLPAEAQ